MHLLSIGSNVSKIIPLISFISTSIPRLSVVCNELIFNLEIATVDKAPKTAESHRNLIPILSTSLKTQDLSPPSVTMCVSREKLFTPRNKKERKRCIQPAFYLKSLMQGEVMLWVFCTFFWCIHHCSAALALVLKVMVRLGLSSGWALEMWQ